LIRTDKIMKNINKELLHALKLVYNLLEFGTENVGRKKEALKIAFEAIKKAQE